MAAMHGSVRLLAPSLAVLLVAGACIPATSLRASATPVGGAPPSAVVVGTPTPAAAALVSGGPTFVRPTPTPLPTFLAYVVKAGDTLTSIARRYRTTARSIAFWNRVQHPSLDPDSPSYQPNRIEVGWVLLLVPDLELDPEDMPPEPAPTPSAPASPSSAPAPDALAPGSAQPPARSSRNGNT
jgi:LysM domain-containing protein